MKKLCLVFCLLAALLALAACGEDDVCHHKRRTDTVYEPDCSAEGYILHVCSDCGYSYKSDFKEPKGHELVKTVTVPTCTEVGYTHYECACGYAYDADFLVPDGHKYTSSIVEATCAESGYTAYTCAVCQYEYKAKWTTPNGHSLTKKTVAATCTEEGYTEYTCGNCEYSYKADFVTPAHTFVKTVYRPTIGTTGYTEYKCRICEHAYNTDHVWYSDIFAGAAGDGKGVLAKGIDLSYYNDTVDFSALKRAGIEYVILRAGGRTGKDATFEKHYAAARAVGLDIGCYYYSYARTTAEALAEAAKLKEYIAGKTFEYPVYFDIEDSSQKNLDKQLLMDICFAFCNSLVESGYFPGVYCNLNWAEEILHTEQLVTWYDVWIARYNDSLPEDYYDSDFGMWQYTEEGTVSGVGGYVDLNYCYKDYPTIIKTFGFNGYTAE